MKLRWQSMLKQVPQLLAAGAPDSTQQLARIRDMERNLVLPVKMVIIIMVFHYLFLSNWTEDVYKPGEQMTDNPPQVALDVIRQFFLVYIVINAGMASLLIGMKHLSQYWIQRAVF